MTSERNAKLVGNGRRHRVIWSKSLELNYRYSITFEGYGTKNISINRRVSCGNGVLVFRSNSHLGKTLCKALADPSWFRRYRWIPEPCAISSTRFPLS